MSNRRDFLRTTAGAFAAAALSDPLAALSKSEPQRFIGIQMGPHTMLHEGIEHCLDLIQETAAVNAVLTYSHAFHSNLLESPNLLAQDHGKPLRDPKSPLPLAWVKTHDQYFRDTTLRVVPPDPTLEYANRDLFTEMQGPARRRGMKVYARILEGPSRAIANREKVVTVDVYGKPTNVACWNHPEYRAFWRALVEDLFRSYDLDGFQWGAERMGPLMNVILPWNETPPTCFCQYCRARGQARGISVERAREGFEKLYVYVRGLSGSNPRPADGVFTGFLRILLRYPEILAWEFQYRLSREEVTQEMYKTIKAIKPTADVGWHVDHQPSSWDLVYRAELSYAEMAPYSDFIKFIAYHDVLGPRIRWWYLERFKKTVLAELPLEESLGLYYDLFGYDKDREPKLNELDTKGFSPDYVYRETKRSVASAEGKTKIYTGVGFDVPWNGRHLDADPNEVYESTRLSFQGGASGIVVSREYEEMTVPNLKAVGRAVRSLG
jgi:hypothetical protein